MNQVFTKSNLYSQPLVPTFVTQVTQVHPKGMELFYLEHHSYNG